MVTARLAHVVDTHDWLSADFHVHAARSPDSRVPMQDRIYEFVADDVQMIVATDHNVVSDYEPYIRELNAGRYITSAIGDELTTGGWGHFGAFPLPRDLERAGQGAVLVHGRHPDDFFKDVRTNAPGAIIDVHHPRIDAEIGYFDIGQFDARTDRAGRAGLLVGLRRARGDERLSGSRAAQRRPRDRRLVLAAQPRPPGDRDRQLRHPPPDLQHRRLPAQLRQAARRSPRARRPASRSRDAVRFHHAFFTTGPFVTLEVNGGTHRRSGPGARRQGARRDHGAGGAVGLRRSRHPLPERQRGQALDGRAGRPAVVRFHDSFEVTTPRDGYVVVRVDGDKSLAPVVGDRKTFTAYPFALTNPVFLDVDGDGKYRAGLPHGH